MGQNAKWQYIRYGLRFAIFELFGSVNIVIALSATARPCRARALTVINARRPLSARSVCSQLASLAMRVIPSLSRLSIIFRFEISLFPDNGQWSCLRINSWILFSFKLYYSYSLPSIIYGSIVSFPY